MNRPTRTRRLLAGLLLTMLVALVAPPLHSETRKYPPAKRTSAGVSYPGESDAGEWNGTWFYKTHKEKWALWMRVEDGVPQMKLQFQNYDQGENFITDWTSVAHYASRQKKGVFKPTIEHRDLNVIRGDWYWQLGTPGEDQSVRTETAEFEMYRAGRGRQLVLVLSGFERVYEGQRVYRMAAEQAWTFHKASRRLVRWEELPF